MPTINNAVRSIVPLFLPSNRQQMQAISSLYLRLPISIQFGNNSMILGHVAKARLTCIESHYDKFRVNWPGEEKKTAMRKHHLYWNMCVIGSRILLWFKTNDNDQLACVIQLNYMNPSKHIASWLIDLFTVCKVSFRIFESCKMLQTIHIEWSQPF